MEAYKNLIKEIEQYIAKLENASLTMDELFELEKLTRKLHERSIILRYKAFENKVGIEAPKKEELMIEAPVEEPNEEPVVEAEEKEEELEFKIFENTEEEEDLGFIFEAPEETSEEEEQEDMVQDESFEDNEVDLKDEVDSEEELPEEEEPVKPVATAGASFLDRFKGPDNSLSSQFAGSKLESLIGAFGLNEKLMFINELFDGSSEMFSDAVKGLDAKASMDEANAMLENLAAEHEWDPEEEAVAEFIIYIQRRHA